MKLEFRQRLLATTLLVGASLVATPAFAQDDQSADQTPNPSDTSAVPTAPETTTPVEGAPTPSTNAQGGRVNRSEEIIVTGSRIPQPNLESANPVTVVTSQEVKLSGTTRTEDLLNSLPQVFAGQGANISNGSVGIATVDLRNLGAGRTKVLINGRNMQPGDPLFPVADLNFIPNQLIKRVDVLTGGASSVYGADAVAGVVNFIMDTTYTGFRIDAQASVFNHHQHTAENILRANDDAGYLPPHGWSTNGGAQDIAAAFGAAFDDGHGHVTAYATYRTQDPVLQSTRDYSFCSLGAFAPQYIPDYGDYYCGGSSTNPAGRFITINPATGGFNKSYHTEGHDFLPGYPLFNYAPYNYYQRPDERYTFGTFADYEISSAFHPYMEAMFMNDHSDAQIAPSGDFGNTTTLNCDNPLMSAQQKSIICRASVYNPADANPSFSASGAPIWQSTFGNLVGATPIYILNSDNKIVGLAGFNAPVEYTDSLGNTYYKGRAQLLRRNVEGGGRDDDLEHTAFRLVGGVKGDIARGVSYDAYYQYGRTALAETYYNDFSVTRLNRALDVVTDPSNGQPVCRSVLDGTDPACVPWNVFQTGGVSDAAVNYLATPAFQRGNVQQTVAHVDMTVVGDEYGWRLPWAETGVGINVGADYIRNSLKFTPDILYQTGDLAGQGGVTPPTEGSYDVRELFGEIQIPIVENNFIDLFTINAGYRFSNYHISGNTTDTDTYKIQAELAPIPDIRFRGGYNRAARAPNVVELFTPQNLGLGGSNDYCAGFTPSASLSQCQNSGVTPAQYGQLPPNPASQYNAIYGGNVNLTPEIADTWTGGVVLQPRFIPGLAATVDYYDIEVKNAISTLGWQTTLQQCLNTGDPIFCSLVHRDPDGSLWLTPGGYIVQTLINIGGVKTSGFDFQASYAHRFSGLGTLNVSFVGTLLEKYIVNPYGDLTYDCAGLYGATCGNPSPKWRHTLRVGLTLPSGLGASVRWRHFDAVGSDYLDPNPILNCDSGQCLSPVDAVLESRDYFDLALTARLAQRLELRLGANNLFDKDPPIASAAIGSGGSFNGNSYPQVYDALGRYLYAGVTVDF